MVRVVLRSCAALLLMVTASALAHTPSGKHQRSPVEWMNGYTLVLVDANSTDELTEARDFIQAQGGRVAIILPPHSIFGWIPAEVESRITGQHHIRSVHRSPVTASTGLNDRATQIAINVFNDISSGRMARDVLSASRLAPGPQNDRPPMPGCSEPHPQINRADLIRNLQMLGAGESLKNLGSDFRPQFFGNSDAMIGSVAVAVFLVESNGGGDPNVYNWSQADQTTAIAQVIEGLNWWVDQSRAFNLARPLQFTVVPYLADNPACQQPYEPVLHPGSEAFSWVNSIMNNLGVGQGQSFVRVAAFDQFIRDQNHADWAFSIFLSYNPAPANPYFTDGRASWAYLGGPYINTLFHSFGWRLSQLISHETGHIFYACDEYSQPGYATCSCTCAPEVRPEAVNGNCQDISCGVQSTQCMMRINEFALCPYTVAQIGWTAVVPKPVPTAPAGLVANASSPTQVNLSWQDTSSVEDGFQIERRGGSSADYAQIAIVPVNSTTYIDSTAISNTAYTYRVRAFNSSGTSAYSAEASAVTPTSTPTLSVGTTSLADATVSVPYSQPLIASGGTAPYAWTQDSGNLPPGITISASGTISGTATTAGTYTFTVKVIDGLNASATRALTLIVKPAAPLTITTSSLPRGSVGATYSQNVGVSGGQTPYAWSIQSGNLPDGLTLNGSSGVISGTPDRASTSSFVIRVSDSSNTSVTATLSIIINPGISTLSLETVSMPDGVVGESYSHSLTAAGGTAPYHWEIKSGHLPAGLQMNETGVITGTPTTAGEVEFEVMVSDQSGQSVNRQLSIDIDPAPELTIVSASSLPVAAVGVPYRYELKATAGSSPYSWVKKKKKKFGTLPEGITVSSDGIISGTPTTQGTYIFTLRVEDAAGRLATKSFTLEVGPPPPPLAIKTETLPQGKQNISYNVPLEALGGAPPYSWAIEGGTLPAGLAMNAEGVISGVPTAIGTAAFTVRLRDAIGTTTIRQFLIIIAQPPPPLVIQTVSLPETTAERAYSQTLQATGGVAPYTWSIASGSLSAGLNLSASGIISGTPVSAGTSVFVVRVTDSAQQVATRTLAIQIKPADKVAPFGLLETPGNRTTLNGIATGTGWALDNVGIATIEILIDNQKVGEATYGQSRPDVAAAWGSFPNAGQAGFAFTFDTTKFSNGDHTLSVRLIDAAGNAVITGTRTITLQNRVFSIVTTDVPRGKKGEAYSTQLQAANGALPYIWTLQAGSLPGGISLSASGLISGTPTVFGTFPFTVRVTDANNTPAVANFTMVVLPDVEPLRVLTSGDLPEGLTGVDYRQQLFFTGGRAPVQWSLVSGQLPTGLTLDSSGLITGRPRQVGLASFTVRVTDSQSQVATSSEIRLRINLGPLGVLNTGTLTSGRTGVDYSLQLLGTGGAGPYTWSIAGGTFPTGLSLGTSSGIITGKPTQVGTFTFTVRITDSTTASAISDTLRIVIDAGPLIITSFGDLTGGQVNVDYSHQLTFLGGRSPYTWALAAGNTLPAGLTLNASTGVISGKPTQAGTFTFIVTLTDGTPQIISSTQLRIIVAP